MRGPMLLALLALAACDPPMQELFPPRHYAVERFGATYDMRAQYDPLVRGWFVDISSIEVPLQLDDLELARSMLEQDLGPIICENRPVSVHPGEIWNDLAGSRIAYMPDRYTWRFVARCA